MAEHTDAARTVLKVATTTKWHSPSGVVMISPMASSMIRFAKSETRDLADADRVEIQRRWGEPTEWTMKSSTFFTLFVVIGVFLTVLALVLR